MTWETIIGLEIHAQLNTKSKLFSGAPNRFGDDPNTNISTVCTGQPGSLPVLNKEAVKKAVQFGLAINAEIAKFSKFDRKSYFYPDSPRNFQITQFDEPIVRGGTVVAEVEGGLKNFAVNRVHLEDDAGMLKHFPHYAGVDYNRSGVPLIEIVSEPCMRSGKEAVAYAMAVRAMLEYIDASDCNMEEGSLRIDCNISVRPFGETALRNKVEIKNMNSFSHMELAIESEVKRQIREYTQNRSVPQCTYRYDPEKNTTILMRRKEDADDYRYFPEPDLLPIILSDVYIDSIREALPELPLEKKRRYIQNFGLTEHHAALLTADKKLADIFEETLKYTSNAKSACAWITVEFMGRFKSAAFPISPKSIAELINLIDNKTITGKIAKSIADEMVLFPKKSPAEIIRGNPDFQPLTDSGEISVIVEQVVRDNAESVADYKTGKEKALRFLIGQVMKLSQGKADPDLVNQLLKEKIFDEKF